MRTITVTDAARNFSDLVSRVHYQGESALLVKGGRAMVKITPVRAAVTGRDLAAAWPTLRHLGMVEANRLERELTQARKKLPALRSKWD